MRRRRADWPKLVARWAASGESAAAFASSAGVNAGTLWRWRRELKRARTTESVGPALAKLIEVRPARLPVDDRFEVRLAGGRSVGVPASFDEATLARLLHVLETAP
jgi:transposase-like protein